ncbi:MAG: hypothetical protein ABXS91_08560 [Sulfurimonas sp.]
MTTKTEEILLQSIPKFGVILKRLTLMESINLSKQKTDYFGFLKRVIESISNLDEMQIANITIQDAIAMTVYYRMYFWGDMEISDNGGLSPSDFIRSCGSEEIDKSTVRIGDYRFSPAIRMKDAIDAERYCASVGDIANLRFYIMGAGCTRKGVKDGIDTIKSLMDDSNDIGALLAYNELIGTLSNIELSFMDGDGKISIVAEKGGERFALPFRGSRFFTFGI